MALQPEKLKRKAKITLALTLYENGESEATINLQTFDGSQAWPHRGELARLAHLELDNLELQDDPRKDGA